MVVCVWWTDLWQAFHHSFRTNVWWILNCHKILLSKMRLTQAMGVHFWRKFCVENSQQGFHQNSIIKNSREVQFQITQSHQQNLYKFAQSFPNRFHEHTRNSHAAHTQRLAKQKIPKGKNVTAVSRTEALTHRRVSTDCPKGHLPDEYRVEARREICIACEEPFQVCIWSEVERGEVGSLGPACQADGSDRDVNEQCSINTNRCENTKCECLHTECTVPVKICHSSYYEHCGYLN